MQTLINTLKESDPLLIAVTFIRTFCICISAAIICTPIIRKLIKYAK